MTHQLELKLWEIKNTYQEIEEMSIQQTVLLEIVRQAGRTSYQQAVLSKLEDLTNKAAELNKLLSFGN